MESLVNDIPCHVYEGLLLLFCIGVFFALISRQKVAWRGFARLVIIEYSFFIYCSTVFFRTTDKVRHFDFTPFWSYKTQEYIVENIMNVVIFLPIGIMLGCAFKSIRWWMVFMIGMILSIAIEVLQFSLKRGFSEIDDVMHNTLGCMIGYILFSLARLRYKRISKRHVAVL